MKKILLFIAIPITIVIAAILALVIFVNPNQFKPLIVEQAKKQTGLDLVIDGDISWQFFPSIGFELGKTALRNPQGFSQENLFKVDSVGIDIAVSPLLDNQLEIGNVSLDGAEFFIETLSDGRKNIDALTQEAAPASKGESNTSTSSNGDLANTESSKKVSNAPVSDWTIHLAGVTVTNASVELQDKQTGTLTKLYDMSFNLSEFAFNQWTNAEFAVKGESNQQKFTATGQLDFKLDQGFKDYALRNIGVEASFNDATNQIESANIGLETFVFDQPNALTYAVTGAASGIDIDLKGAGSLNVDKAISQITLSNLTLDANFTGDTLPQSPMKVDMTSDVSFDLNKSHLNFVLEKLTANAIALDGKADVTLGDIPKVRFSLHSPSIDLDEFLGTSSDAVSQAATKSEQATSEQNQSSSPQASSKAEVEPDLSALKTLDVKGDILIDKFKVNNARMQDVNTKFTINRGMVDLNSFSANLYGGSVKATAQLDARKTPATYKVSKQIVGVKIQPLLVDVANNDKLEGTGNIDVNVTGKSLTPTGIKKNLAGTVVINFADGAVNGINIAQLIRENYAKFKGQKTQVADEVQKTDFSAMTATLTLNKGIVSTNNLHAQSPLLRIRGNGSANYLNETVDFTISTSIVGSLKGQGGKDIDELKDLTIPINVSGEWAKPKFKLVFDDVLKQKAQKELDRGLKKLDEKLGEKIKDEKTKEAINGLIKGLFN
ncbi:AsmA family protein [Vibrio sinensis]|uniref:AsmA family protein n=1 Tax=Vibrio sinensis TaxID=2302434 RepID=A0A3A6Q9G0_9VIBR|nr:AsmA family protein [Vibrio sinensis]RJX68459.1 AsmA family protein [Vibrio sinensis]